MLPLQIVLLLVIRASFSANISLLAFSMKQILVNLIPLCVFSYRRNQEVIIIRISQTLVSVYIHTGSVLLFCGSDFCIPEAIETQNITVGSFFFETESKIFI